MSKKIFQLFSTVVFCVIFSMLIVPTLSLAQRDEGNRDNLDNNRDNNRDNRDNNRYNREDNNRDYSRYERRYTKRQVAELIRRIETSSNRFRRDLDRDLDRGRLDGSRREDNINIDIKKFEEAFNQLRRDFDSSDRWWESRRNVEISLDTARPVATRLRNNRISSNVQNQWRNLRRDLNQLASRYNLPQLS
jgi:hypothetical protein